ncbi:hypothetical protein LJC71_07135 [Desulfosarcina sp. OttesenSCG-928-A07]|nr:hypothetical protein [Desulfosarcina sp. OttesenSCG-928-A07]
MVMDGFRKTAIFRILKQIRAAQLFSPDQTRFVLIICIIGLGFALWRMIWPP